jgi:hypothetical protein
MAELKILVFGLIFLVRPFSIILNSFQNEFQKVVLYLSELSNKMAKEVPILFNECNKFSNELTRI